MTHISALTAIACLAAVPGYANAQATNLIEYEHWEMNDNRTYSAPVAIGSFFEVRVAQTCDAFSIGVVAVPAAGPPTPGVRGRDYFKEVVDCVIQATPQVQLVPHASDAIGGYDVLITRKDGKPEAVRAVRLKAGQTANQLAADFNSRFAQLFPNNVDTPRQVTDAQLTTAFATFGDFKTLKNVRLHVHMAPAEDWLLSFAGGFSLNDLTDPEFAVVGPAGNQVVTRDFDAEGSVDPGLVSFIHLTPTTPKWGKRFAVSFGIGLSDDNKPSYYFGPSWRMGAYGYITAGLNWHDVTRLPNGQVLGAAPIDANVMSNLKTRMDDGAFIAWTYPFLGKGKAAFEKPFTTVGSTPQTPAVPAR